MKKLIIILLSLYLSSSIFAQNKIETFLKAENLYNNGQLEASEKYLLQMSNENPYNGFYYYLLGINYNIKGEYRKSITELCKAQKLGIQYQANYFQATNYLKLDKRDSAIYFLKEYVSTPFKGPDIDEVYADSTFYSLLSSPEFLNIVPPKISEHTSETDAWLKDINYLSNMLKETHYSPYFKLSKLEWDNEIKKLNADIPTLSQDQILVRILQFIAKMGDAHTQVLNKNYSNNRYAIQKLPIFVELFNDECYITKTSDNYKNLLGAKIIKINNIDIDSIYKTVCTLIPRDNEMWCKTLFGYYFRNANLLHGLGLCEAKDKLEIVYSLNNKIEVKVIETFKDDINNNIPMIDYHTYFNAKPPMFLENIRKAYWYKHIEKEKVLYIQINRITSLDNNPLEQFCDSIKDLSNTQNISSIIFDIRNNTGGSSRHNKTILKFLLSENINVKGKLFVVIGRSTFSAAQNLTSDIEYYTDAIFIGEPTGSSPNFIGEINTFKLPYSGLLISSSNVYHQRADFSSDTRIWKSPDIYKEFTFEDFKTGNDPVLNEIINYTRNISEKE